MAMPMETGMEMRTILAAVSGGSASAGVIELACLLARRFDSHVEFYHTRPDPHDMLVVPADGLGAGLTADIVASALNEAARIAEAAHALCDTAIARHGLSRQETPSAQAVPSACWREETGYAPVMLAARARLFDLAILGRSGRSGRVVDEPHGEAVEETLLSAGRPVLVAPASAPDALGERVAVGWNDSLESTRALAAALPFLRRAKAVSVLSLGESNAAALVEHLGWYGIRAAADRLDRAEGVAVGVQLLAAARDRGADLLVMGGYGKSPLRQMLFGGATRDIIGTSLLPLLVAH
jgi:nucleotide-binding universal stress UspA family protein